MKNVYFIPLINSKDKDKISFATQKILSKLIELENIKLESEIPIKLHFGEKGNITFIKPECFNGIINYLKEKKIATSFIETNVLYKSDRTKKDTHIALAREHGFTQLPIIIADGEIGEDYVEVEINKKHFKKCMIGRGFSKFHQFIIVSHFKGHELAGFGGAIKQLGMGFASRGGKLSQHVNSIPLINPLQCKKCGICIENCPASAITMKSLSISIDKKKCIGCAACIAVCPNNALKINWGASLSYKFSERLAEHAFAAQKNKNNIYISLAIDITKNCDCIGEVMKPIHSNLGVFASTDPVAIDAACLDMLKKVDGKTFSDKKTLAYAEKIGLGKREYKLIKLEQK